MPRPAATGTRGPIRLVSRPANGAMIASGANRGTSATPASSGERPWNVVRGAAASGVGHVVALSRLDADPRSPFCYAFTYARTETTLRASGCAYSIARTSLFAEFFLRWLRPARTTGQIRVPAGDDRISLVSQADVARCLAALALGDPTGGHHVVTGPEALGLEEVAARRAGASAPAGRVRRHRRARARRRDGARRRGSLVGVRV